MPPRSIWTGTISFGLVNIPVRLVTAVRRVEISFHQLHKTDGIRLRQKLVCPADQEEVSRDDIVKGYEIAPDQYVIVEKDELDAFVPESSRNMDITDFVALEEIDPIYYDRPYYLLPGDNAERPYHLLVRAMEQAGKVGIAKFVMRQKEYLAALRPVQGAICLEIMHFAEEVVPIEDLGVPGEMEIEERQLKVANQLIEALAAEFEPDKYHDEYTEQVRELLERKAEGEVITAPPVAEGAQPTEPVDLLAALEESLRTARERQPQPA